MANVIGTDPVAWSIDGGRHRGELLRIAEYASTSGADGIVTAGDCKVSQLSTPGSQIRISAGAILVRNRSANVVNQTYVVNNRTETRLDVKPTGASGRTDLVIFRVEDPQYSPWPQPSAADAPTYQYARPIILEGAGTGVTDVSQLNLGYSAYAVARLEIPANTTNITDAMIKDIRFLALPRSRRRLFAVTLTGADHFVQTDQWVNWPASSTPFQVPYWATEFIFRITITGVWVPADAVGVSVRGAYSLFNGPLIATTAVTPFINQAGSRFDLHIADQLPVPAANRGGTVYLYTQGAKFPTAEAGGPGRLAAGNGTRITYDVEWLETAV